MASTPALIRLSAALTLALAAALELAPYARADATLDRYQPAPSSADGFALSRPDTAGHLRPDLQLQLDYAHDPLVWEAQLGNADTVRTKIVQAHLVAHALAAFSLYRRVLLFAHLPVNLVMSGDSAPDIAPDGSTLGNTRVGARARLYGEVDDIFGLAVQGALGIPSSRWVKKSAELSGESTPVGEVQALAEVRHSGMHFTLNAGVRIREQQPLSTLELYDEFSFGAGLSYDVKKAPTTVQLLGELYGVTALSDFAQREHSPIEGLLGTKVGLRSGLTLGFAAALGITHGYGSPAFRLVATSAWAPIVDDDLDDDGYLDHRDACPRQPEDRRRPLPNDGCPEEDRDHDAATSPFDSCPDVGEDVDGFQDTDGCPDFDNDGDSSPDDVDRCPDEAEDRDGYRDEDGCSDDDDDADGVADANDRCKDEAEDRDGFEDEDGCVDPDNDLDSILDASDRCPLEAETINLREDEDGCPDLVRLDAERGVIVTLEPIHFALRSAEILPASFGLLSEVAMVLKQHAEITSVSIQGHTDSQGNDARNQKLSLARATSVRDFLMRSGVVPERLVAQGFGEARPIGDNATAEGRALNRRVEFHVGLRGLAPAK